MDNEQMPPVRPMTPYQPTGPMPPNRPMSPNGAMSPNMSPMNGGQRPVVGPNGMPMVQQVHVMPEPKKDVTGIVKTVVIVLLSLLLVTFIGLFIWKMVEAQEVQANVDETVNIAVAQAKDEQAMELEKNFQEREKNPYSTFSGPADYGQVTFQYPKTWSVYVDKSAEKGGDFNAYFNPVQVDTVDDETINALRMTISTQSYDDITKQYESSLKGKTPKLTIQSVDIGNAEAGTSTKANYYTGTIPGSELSGYIVTFKLRDKTVILQTDSVLFADDFNQLLKTIVYNA